MVIRKHLPIPCLWNTLPHQVRVFCFWFQCCYLCLLIFPLAIGYCAEKNRTCKSFQLCREPHEFEEFNMEYPGKKLHLDKLWIIKFNLLPSAINKLLDNSIEVKVVGYGHPCKFILIHLMDDPAGPPHLPNIVFCNACVISNLHAYITHIGLNRRNASK